MQINPIINYHPDSRPDSYRESGRDNYQLSKMARLLNSFFTQDAVTVAEKLLSKTLVRVWDDGTVSRYRITQTEAYMGADDLGCHASKGRTPRTEVMYAEGGSVYVYLIYGMYWMLNFVTGAKNEPQAVLICGIDAIVGSGRVGRVLKIDKSFYAENLLSSPRIWIEDAPDVKEFETTTRVGIDYAGDEWKNKPWRFTTKK
ncbi:MAG: DNA-3-methyladenine glycosylase [Paludibacter sp.]|nr:DNA-3-methyladenine glycosylase [Paludibacter sp.]